MDLIPDDILNKRTITKDLEDLINNLSFVYDLKEDNLRDIIINSIDISHKIDKEKYIKYKIKTYKRYNALSDSIIGKIRGDNGGLYMCGR